MRDVRQAVGLALTLWMFLTPIVYPASMVPDRFKWVLAVNPMSYLVEAYARRRARRSGPRARPARGARGHRPGRLCLRVLGVHALQARPSRICSDGLTRDRNGMSFESLQDLSDAPPSGARDPHAGNGTASCTDFWALQDVALRGRRRHDAGHHRRQRLGQEHAAAGHRRNHPADHGRVSVHGRVSSLLELGAGVNPEFTGRENVEFYGGVMGMTREEIAARPAVMEAMPGSASTSTGR